MNTSVTIAPREIRPQVPTDRPLRILHVLHHSPSLRSGRAPGTVILHEQRALGWQPVELSDANQRGKTERTWQASVKRYRSVYADALKRCVQREVKRHD